MQHHKKLATVYSRAFVASADEVHVKLCSFDGGFSATPIAQRPRPQGLLSFWVINFYMAITREIGGQHIELKSIENGY